MSIVNAGGYTVDVFRKADGWHAQAYETLKDGTRSLVAQSSGGTARAAVSNLAQRLPAT